MTVEREPDAASAGSLGLLLLLVALAVLFAATLVATWWFRDSAPGWSQDRTSVPPGFWATSAVLVLLSAAAERAARRSAAGADASARAALYVAGACSLLFLAGQTWNWMALLDHRRLDARPSFVEFSFYLLTVLHALHVLGGIVWTGVALRLFARAAPRRAAAARACAIYWHFLTGVWAVILLDLGLLRVEDPAATALGPLSLGLAAATLAACAGYQILAILEFWRRGKPGLAFWSLLPPFAMLAYWAYAGEWGRYRRLAHWSLAWMLLIVFALLAVAIHAEALFPPEGPGQPLLPGGLDG